MVAFNSLETVWLSSCLKVDFIFVCQHESLYIYDNTY